MARDRRRTAQYASEDSDATEELAILEKNPERVLYWYDRLPKKRYGWYGTDDDAIAAAVQTHAPDRAVAIWKSKAERLIAQVKPKAYQEAGKYLRKAAKVMAEEKNKWIGIDICKALGSIMPARFD